MAVPRESQLCQSRCRRRDALRGSQLAGDGDGEVPGLVALDAATGEERWSVAREGFAAHSPVVTDDVVYDASDDNRLDALDAATGGVHWSLGFEWDFGTPALLEDALAVSAGGRIYSITAAGDADAHPWAGVVQATDDSATRPTLEYPEHDFYFGTNGYDITSSAEGSTGDDAPLDFTVDVTGERITADDAVTVEFALTNEDDESVTIENGAPAPFGVVTLRENANTGRTATAWTPAYDESEHVHTTSHRGVIGVDDIVLSETIEPGETVRAEYTLSAETHGIRPGAYTFHEGYRVYSGASGRPDDDWVWNASAYVRVELEQPGAEEGDVRFDMALMDETAVPEAFIGDLSVNVLEPGRDIHPALVEITLENDADSLGSVLSPGRLPFASSVGLAADGSRLALLSEDMFAPAYVVDAGDDGSWVPVFQPHLERVRGRGSSRFEPDARRAKRYLVLGHPEAEAPLTPGEYVFEQGYADDDVEFPWSFRLSLRARDG